LIFSEKKSKTVSETTALTSKNLKFLIKPVYETFDLHEKTEAICARALKKSLE
jgi:hypothetical protein